MSAVALYTIESASASSTVALSSSPAPWPPASGRGPSMCVPILCGPSAMAPPSGESPCLDHSQGGLQEATAGVLSSFLITARDEQVIGWLGDTWDRTGAVGVGDAGGRLVAELSPGGAHVVSASLAPGTTGSINVGVVGGTAGEHLLAVGVAHPGGLLASYFSDPGMAGEADSYGVEPVVDASAASLGHPVVAAGAGGVRWCGYVAPLEVDQGRPQFNGGIQTYTFRISSGEGEARLWLNGTLLAETGKRGGEVETVGVPLTPRTLTSITLEWMPSAPGGGVTLRWYSPQVPLEVVPSDRLFSAKSAALPVRVLIQPGPPQSGVITPLQTSPSAGTAGIRVPFAVTVMDVFGNSARAAAGDAVIATVQPVDGLGRGSTSEGIPDASVGVFGGELTSTRAGPASLSAYTAATGGLSATYYSGAGMEPGVAVKAGAWEGALDYSAGAGGLSSVSSLASLYGGFGAIYAGFVEPPATGEYTVHAAVGSDSERVKVWVDGKLIVDQWTSLSSTEPSASLPLTAPADQPYYHIRISYREASSGSVSGAGLSLKWESAALSKEVIPSSRLRSASILAEAAIQFKPAPADPATSLLTATSSATAGGLATFFLQVMRSKPLLSICKLV